MNENKESKKSKECKDIESLIPAALQAQKAAYAPYSHFRVGAALLCKDGTVYTGCNIENASYPAGNCAERTAIFKAVSEGRREFLAICVVGGREGEDPEYCPPCGICRQVCAEFCDADSFQIILAKSENEYTVHTLGELLPLGFGAAQLVKNI
ncbi:MAG: cytidine deaminase [Eubacterium sp.]|nr:cytidine deaminase [Eubacterium sp.]